MASPFDPDMFPTTVGWDLRLARLTSPRPLLSQPLVVLHRLPLPDAQAPPVLPPRSLTGRLSARRAGSSGPPGRFDPHQPHEDLSLKDDLVYSSWLGGGLRVFNVANSYRPKEAGRYIPPTPEGQEAGASCCVCSLQRPLPRADEEAASDILGVAGGFMRSGAFQQFERAMALTEALAANWANIATLAVGLVVCFAASYMMFLRSEIRPRD